MTTNNSNLLNFQKFLDSKEIKQKIQEYKNKYYEVLFNTLPSPYSINHPSSNYAIYLSEIAEELARLRCLTDRIQLDNYFQTVQPILLRQNLATVLNYDQKIPFDWSHEKYRNFLLAVLEVLLNGSTKENIRRAIQIFTSLDAKISEFLDFIPSFLQTNLGSYFNNLTSPLNGDGRVGFKEFTFNDSSYQRFVYSAVDIFGFRIDLNFGTGDAEEYFRSWADHFRDIYWLLEIIKPAHTYYLIRNIFQEDIKILNRLTDKFLVGVRWHDEFSQGIFKFNDPESLFNSTLKLLNKAILFDKLVNVNIQINNSEAYSNSNDPNSGTEIFANSFQYNSVLNKAILNYPLISNEIAENGAGTWNLGILTDGTANWKINSLTGLWLIDKANIAKYHITSNTNNTITTTGGPNSGSINYIISPKALNLGLWSGGTITVDNNPWTNYTNALKGAMLTDITNTNNYSITSNTNNTITVSGGPATGQSFFYITRGFIFNQKENTSSQLCKYLILK